MLDPLEAARREAAIGGIGGAQPSGPAGASRPSTGPAFADVLAGAVSRSDEVKFSSHALQRIEKRAIPLDNGSLARLASGVDRAAAKGSRSSLVLVNDTAFVVAVPSRTVVTAVDRESMRDQVFTNIDSAVIA